MDVPQREGNYPPPPGASSILGVEFSGNITELGPDVSDYNVGDEVLGLVGGGAYAEYVVCSKKLLIPKPSHLTWAEAASIPENFLTGLYYFVVTKSRCVMHGRSLPSPCPLQWNQRR
jgi:NADPH:quinone reductase-like Zn-dependent oxidoreductase